MQKIIFATHLLPFQIDPITNKLEKRKRHTSVYAVTSIRHLYIGLAEECYDDSRFAAVNCIPLSASKSTLYGHYEGYCKQELWPLLHYMNSNKNENSDNWKCYQIVNQMFADAIVQNYVPGDAIWINDYHLLMVSFHNIDTSNGSKTIAKRSHCILSAHPFSH